VKRRVLVQALAAPSALAIFASWPGLQRAILGGLFPDVGDLLYSRSSLLSLLADHLILTLTSTFAAALAGFVLGLLAFMERTGAGRRGVAGISGVAQTFPPAAVIALAVPSLGFGAPPVLLALFLYGMLPVVVNTVKGFDGVSPRVREAARGVGMNRAQQFLQVELPLALPVILAGVRISAVINVGTAAIGAVAGAGGLGGPIIAGLVRFNPSYVLQGALATALLALSVDALFGLLATATRVPGAES
jgi:osmoprotectant transport system permease protein